METCVPVVCVITIFGILANFNVYDEDDFEEFFFAQHSKGGQCVSLEEDVEYKTVHDPQYSDISDSYDEISCFNTFCGSGRYRDVYPAC